MPCLPSTILPDNETCLLTTLTPVQEENNLSTTILPARSKQTLSLVQITNKIYSQTLFAHSTLSSTSISQNECPEVNRFIYASHLVCSFNIRVPVVLVIISNILLRSIAVNNGFMDKNWQSATNNKFTMDLMFQN